MIEEMDEAGELRGRLGWAEHDLDHVSTERDKAQEKLDAIYAMASQALKGFGSLEHALKSIKMLSRS